MISYFPSYLIGVWTFLSHIIEHLLHPYTKTSSDQVPDQSVLEFACIDAIGPDICCPRHPKRNKINKWWSNDDFLSIYQPNIINISWSKDHFNPWLWCKGGKLHSNFDNVYMWCGSMAKVEIICDEGMNDDLFRYLSS